MNIDVTTEIDISRPRAEVAAFAADLDNATTWYKDIKAARWETPRPLQVGSRIAFEPEFLGRRLAYTYQVPEQTVPASAGERLPGDRTLTGPPGGVHTSDMPNAANSFGSMNTEMPVMLTPSMVKTWMLCARKWPSAARA